MSLVSQAIAHLKTRVDERTIAKLRRFQASKFRRLQHVIYSALFGGNLRLLTDVYNSDKWGLHWYAQHYESILVRYERKAENSRDWDRWIRQAG